MNNLNAGSLLRAGRSVKEPFQLSVIKDDESLAQIKVRKILRLLPRRRIVAVAEEGDKQILVKLFIGRSADRYTGREIKGVSAIESAGVQTPAFAWQGTLAAGGGRVVAFEYLEGARDLKDVWQQASDENRLALMRNVIPELAKLHQGGVVQNDIHPENFLFLENQIYTIDGGDVSRGRNAPLSEKNSLDNLALFLAQFHARFDDLIPDVLAIYEEAREWLSDADRVVRLRPMVLRKRAQRKKDYVGKAFRECTRFSCQSTLKRFAVCERKYDSPEMQALMNDPDSAIKKGRLLKDGNTTTVALVDGPCGPLVIKRYNIKNFSHRLQRMFRKSRAWHSWANTLKLEFFGIRTLKPVAMVEERFGPLRGRAYFMTEYVEGPDATALAEKNDPEVEMSSIVKILQGLSQAGVTHGDLKASNFLLTREGAVILDLDSMTEHVRNSDQMKAEKKDRERFLANWVSSPGLEKQFTELLGQGLPDQI